MSHPIAVPEVPAHFHRDAPLEAHQRRRHRAVLAALARVPRGRLLDYGCGWGDITWSMARTHPDIQAVDVDPERVEYARREFAPLEFSTCRPDGLDFPDASFDCVASVVVLPFVPDVDAYMAEIKRVLRHGGHLVLAAKVCRRLRQLKNWLTRHPQRSRESATGLRVHTGGDVMELLGRHGFGVIERSGFFDPPFEAHRNVPDVINAAVESLAELLHVDSIAPYQVFRCRLGDVRRA